MQKERQALPPAARFRINRMLGNARFAHRLDEESRLFQRQKVGRDRAVLAAQPALPLDDGTADLAVAFMSSASRISVDGSSSRAAATKEGEASTPTI